MKISSNATLIVFMMVIVANPVFAKMGDSITYRFNWPTHVASNSSDSVAIELTLTEIAGGVQFVLKPDWTSPAFADPVNTSLNRLDFVYQGPEKGITLVQPIVHGADIQSFTFQNDALMNGGFRSEDQHITIDWFSPNRSGRFDRHFSDSVWIVLGEGINLADFAGVKAWSIVSNQPDSVFGVVSVGSQFLTSVQIASPNWEDQITPSVPKPEISTMLLVIMGLIGFSLRRPRIR